MSRRRASVAIRDDLRRAEHRLRLTPDGIHADLLRLRLMVGFHAFNALRKGLYLQRWRGTSPHNWWVESKRGTQLWHSDTQNWGHHPDLFLFQVKTESTDRVPMYGGHDQGHPFHTDYVLKAEYLLSASP